MKVFLSSIITGFEQYREAAAHSIRVLGHNVIRAEDFGASPASPQQLCMDGVRSANVMVLILGEHYGYLQASGLSATHEEFREAQERCPVLIFVQKDVKYDQAQASFLEEARAWDSGRFYASFTSPQDLQDAITQSLHNLELSQATGRADEAEMLSRAKGMLPPQRNALGTTLCLVVAGGPRQQVLRPAQLESKELITELQKNALFGDENIFLLSSGISKNIEGHTLILTQDHASIALDELGTIRILRSAQVEPNGRSHGSSLGLIEEEIRERIEQSLRFAGKVLDQIDDVKRLSDVVPVIYLLGASYQGWRTLAEHRANPTTMTIGMNVPDPVEVLLSPARRSRAALILEAERLAEDFTVLLRRHWR